MNENRNTDERPNNIVTNEMGDLFSKLRLQITEMREEFHRRGAELAETHHRLYTALHRVEELEQQIAKAPSERELLAARESCERYISQIETLSQQVHVPGRWHCDECGFVLNKAVLYVLSGTVGVDEREVVESCPNDGLMMRPRTWKEDAEQAQESILALIKERNDYKSQFEAAAAQIDRMKVGTGTITLREAAKLCAEVETLKAERDRCAAVCEWLHNAKLEITSNSPAELPEVDRMIAELEACAKLKGEKAAVHA